MADMDKKIIRAYLWQEVIRLGFRPSGEKEQKNWLHQYLKSLNGFLEIDSSPNIKPGGSSAQVVAFTYMFPINLQIEGTIEKTDKFNVNFFYLPPSNDKNFNYELIWDHDVDGKFFTFPVQDFLSHHDQRKKALKEFSDEDIATVLDSIIFHPAAHQHIESPIDKHEIRIGGGIGNAFQFLFHLRYQFCPDNKNREEEKKRLIKLFAEAIRENSEVSINQLMSIPMGS